MKRIPAAFTPMSEIYTKSPPVTRWVLILALLTGIAHGATPQTHDELKETRVVVIANTTAEADGLMAVLNSSDVRPGTLGAPQPAAQYSQQPPSKPPEGLRGFYTANGITIEFWCAWELPGGKQSIDSTLNKVRQLPNAIQQAGKNFPAMVIAFGTGAGHWETSYNGAVVVGSAVLLHSLASLENKEVTNALASRGVALDQIIESPKGWDFLSKKLFRDLFSQERAEIESKFVKPPLNPAADPIVLLSPNRLGLASINVVNPGDYARADTETLDVAKAAMSTSATTFEVGGVETTHGLIRAFTPKDAPFIYVTAITNRLGYFPMELSPRRAAQHVATINNAGVVAAYLVDWILRNPVLLTP
jgi:hypothetical protein